MRIVSCKFWKVAVKAPEVPQHVGPQRRLKVSPQPQDWPLLKVTGTGSAIA